MGKIHVGGGGKKNWEKIIHVVGGCQISGKIVWLEKIHVGAEVEKILEKKSKWGEGGS